MQNFRALGAPPPHPRASGGWGLCPQTPSLRRVEASPPDPHWPPVAGGSAPRPPKQPPPLRISGYAPDNKALVPNAYQTQTHLQTPCLHLYLPLLQLHLQYAYCRFRATFLTSYHLIRF